MNNIKNKQVILTNMQYPNGKIGYNNVITIKLKDICN